MPVYHFTLHAYRSWMPDHPRGFVLKNRGIQAPNPALAVQYNHRANAPAIEFSGELQQIIIDGLIDICSRRNWRLHAVGADPSHVHFIISWHDTIDWQEVRDKVKNLLSLFLGKAANKPGTQWFVKYGSRKRVKDQKHLDHLINVYLPSHRGLFWREDMKSSAKGCGLPTAAIYAHQ